MSISVGNNERIQDLLICFHPVDSVRIPYPVHLNIQKYRPAGTTAVS